MRFVKWAAAALCALLATAQLPVAAHQIDASSSAFSLDACKKRSSGAYFDGRFDLCVVNKFTALEYRTVGNGPPVVIGRLTGRYIVTGKAPAKGSRDVQFQVSFDRLKGFNTLKSGAVIRASVTCIGCKTGTTGASNPKGEWAAGKTESLTIHGPTGAGSDMKGQGRLAFVVTVRSATKNMASRSKSLLTDVRCDAAKYLNKGSGCVFLSGRGVFVLGLSDERVDEAAAHIRDAFFNPGATFPMFKGKTIPGRNIGQPLHRLFDSKLAERNHAAALRVCQQNYPVYSLLGQDCDEFPFKSTQEGAAKGDRRFSARAIESGDNRCAGNALGQFYANNRVLDGDAFNVGLRP